ncbi:hypothetical protein L596_020466 [Steinernema carpocapsae]|uniref:Peptidase S1 domain-containing protein n=1 Tax=Steinernema carpocapsae TaxID=34508 RepID=A0A4U5MTM0_STECR|nr:hypothetical protein L596_020466 [Steinernema carpocapsae]
MPISLAFVTLFVLSTSAQDRTNGRQLVINGQLAELGQFPFHVRIIVQKPDKTIEGTAFIIDNGRYLVTAAHNLHRVPPSQVRQFQSSDWRIHGHFSYKTLKNDIALIRLPRPFNTSATNAIKSIDIRRDDNFYAMPGTEALTIGFGDKLPDVTSDELRFAAVTIKTFLTCKTVYPQINSPAFCAETNMVGSSKGDSGGPLLVLDEQNRFVPVGVVSFGPNTTYGKLHQDQFPTVYTRLSAYCDWIESKTRKEYSCI